LECLRGAGRLACDRGPAGALYVRAWNQVEIAGLEKAFAAPERASSYGQGQANLLEAERGRKNDKYGKDIRLLFV